VLQSCNNEESQTSEPKLSNVAIGLTSEVVGSRATTNLQGAALDPSTEIGVYVQKSDGVADYGYLNHYCTNQQTDAGVDSIVQSTQMYFPLATGSVDIDIRAYAPYENTYGFIDTYDFSIQTDQSTSAGYLKSDLMYGLPTAGNPVHHTFTHDPEQKKQNVPLTFNHLLSKISLTLEPTGSLTAEALVGADIKIKQVATTVPFNLADGLLGTAKTPADVLMGEISSTEDLTVSALLPPQTVSSGTLFFEITLVNGDVYEYVVPSSADLTLNGGSHYRFKMKFSPGKISEVTMTIADWVGVAGHYVL
jgi:hypothetical protein